MRDISERSDYMLESKAVLFDLGGTLIETALTTFETFQKILEQNKIYVSAEQIEEAFTVAKREFGDEFERLLGRIPLSELYRIWNAQVLKALGIADDGNLARRINEQWLTVCGITLYPDVAPALARLMKERIKRGIISNAYQKEIEQICDITGLDDHFFDIAVGADTVKKPKPHPEIFLYTLQKLEVTPEQAIYVGNELEKDYRPAQRVGMIPLLIVRENTEVPESVNCIRSLMDLTNMIG